MILTNILKNNAKNIPDSPALTMRMGYRTVTLNYRDVYDYALAVARLLEQEGINKGDPVIIFAQNSPYWICVFWGALLRGCPAVPLTTQSTPEMIRKIAQQTQAKIIFTSPMLKHGLTDIKSYTVELLPEILATQDVLKPDCVLHFQDAAQHGLGTSIESERGTQEILESDLVQILYTSGTTGDPKGVMLTHKNMWSNLIAVSQVFKFSGEHERLLSILPLSHILEQMADLLVPFYYGAHVIYAHSPGAIRQLMCEHKITKMAAVPEFLKLLMARIELGAEQKGKKKLFDRMMQFSLFIGYKPLQRLLFRSVLKNFGGSLDTVLSGGAPLDPEIEKKWGALGIYVLQGYGLTETSPTVTSNTYEDRRFGSVGKPVPGVNVNIMPDGEIWVKGPNVFQGYFKNEEKTKESFSDDGWFKTGDIGELDKNGFLFLRGRKKYMILGPGGQNVFPEDLETELNTIAGVKDSCVLGRELLNGVHEIHAVLLLDDGDLKPEEIVQRANQNLATYQQITGWSVWLDSDFPRSATRKIKRDAVLAHLKEHGQEQQIIPAGRKSRLIKLLASVTGVEMQHITETTKIVQELKLDSLMRIELVARIEEDFGVLIDESSIIASTTVAELEDTINKKEPVKDGKNLKRWPRTWWACWLRIVGQELLFLVLRCFIKVRAQGLENLRDLKLPVIIMPNHVSYIDSFVLVRVLPMGIRKKIGFAAGKDVLYEQYKQFAFMGEFLFNAFPFPRKENENIKIGLESMGRFLDDQFSVVIFPEGKMSLNGLLQPFKRGAGLVAVEMDACVVPVKIKGLTDLVPYGKFFPRKRGTVDIVFGKPIKFNRSDGYDQVTAQLQKTFQEL